MPWRAVVAPGALRIEPGEESVLLRGALAARLVAAERGGRAAPRAAIAALSRRLGERETGWGRRSTKKLSMTPQHLCEPNTAANMPS